MTRATNAKVAGFTFLFYTAAAFGASFLFGRATIAGGTSAELSHIAQHVNDMRVAVVLTLITCFAAIVLGVTLYAITRDYDQDLAMVALVCRTGEGVLSAIVVLTKLELLWLATTAAANGADTQAAEVLAAFLTKGTATWNATAGPTFFAVGSLLFSWLLLRGRIVPITLARLGVAASVLAVLAPSLQILGLLGDSLVAFVWLFMLAFEIPLALWLIVRGASIPARRQSS